MKEEMKKEERSKEERGKMKKVKMVVRVIWRWFRITRLTTIRLTRTKTSNL